MTVIFSFFHTVQHCQLFTFVSAVCLPFDSLSTGVTGEDVMLLSGEHRSSKLLPLPSRLDSLIGDKGVQSLEVRLSLAYVCLMEDKTTLVLLRLQFSFTSCQKCPDVFKIRKLKDVRRRSMQIELRKGPIFSTIFCHLEFT